MNPNGKAYNLTTSYSGTVLDITAMRNNIQFNRKSTYKSISSQAIFDYKEGTVEHRRNHAIIHDKHMLELEILLGKLAILSSFNIIIYILLLNNLMIIFHLVRYIITK